LELRAKLSVDVDDRVPLVEQVATIVDAILAELEHWKRGRPDDRLRGDTQRFRRRRPPLGWPDLPSEASLDESSGERCFQPAVDQTDWDVESEPRLYREDGQPVTARDELEALQDEIEAADEQYWVVPGIVQRYAAMPDPEDIDEPLYCVSCPQVTGHDAVGKDGIAGHPHRRRTIWACKTCGQPRHESQRDSDTPTHTGYEHLPDDVSAEDIHGDEPDFGEREFQTQMDAYRERHGCFPWEQ
jgi:hypothetical protein